MAKICVVTCYKDPDYVRARVLRTAIAQLPEHELIVIKNTHTGALRYPEVLWRLIRTRITQRPDIYLLTFRGYEFLPFFVLITVGKRRVFDELINLIEWVVYEHHKVKVGSLPARLLWSVYRLLLTRFDAILTDTLSHAHYSADLMRLPRERFHTVPVGADETVFSPVQRPVPTEKFQVFYYGSMLPLHGLRYVIEAARLLASNPRIQFLIVGGKDDVKAEIAQAKQQGAHTTYKTWVPFTDLPNVIAHSALCLGGPFGGTLQATMVTTGKTYQFMAMGAPVLVGKTNETGTLRDGIDCLMVPQADAAALAAKIAWAEQHSQKLEMIGRAGRQTYEHHFAAPIIAATVGKLLRTL